METSAPTRPRRAPALPPDERRAAIVAAAQPLVAEHGEGVTTRQIAEAAGIAEGTLFRVFADKDEVLAAVLDAARDLAPFEAGIRAIDPGLAFEEKLEQATALLQQRIVEIWILVSNVGPRLRHRVERPLPLSEALVDLLATGQAGLRLDARTAARLLRSLTLALTHPMLAETPLPAREIVELFLRGAAAGTTTAPPRSGGGER